MYLSEIKHLHELYRTMNNIYTKQRREHSISGLPSLPPFLPFPPSIGQVHVFMPTMLLYTKPIHSVPPAPPWYRERNN